MRIETRLTGTSALVVHNIQLADPDNAFTKAIAQITSKRKKTEEDRLEIARLEFAGGLYIDAEGPYMPAANVLRCFTEAAKVRRLGKSVERAVHVVDQRLPLLFDGPRTVDELWSQPKYRYSAMVGVGTKRVSRMRPQFPRWELVAEWEIITEALDFNDFTSIAANAGVIEGLGDNRRNGYGRFSVEIKEL